MTKCWCTSFLDNLDHGLAILKDDEMYFGRAPLLSRLWIHVQHGTLLGYRAPLWRHKCLRPQR
eukprot:6295069-Pyramimonas_sp.AAC.1